MDNYKQFRGFFIGVLVTVVLSVGGWAFSAQAAQLTSQQKDISDLKIAVERLKTLAEMQASFNERVTRHIEEPSAPGRP